jgi:hypothetical protein
MCVWVVKIPMTAPRSYPRAGREARALSLKSFRASDTTLSIGLLLGAKKAGHLDRSGKTKNQNEAARSQPRTIYL